MIPTNGGRLVQDGPDSYEFIGTLEQMNGLSFLTEVGARREFNNVIEFTAVTVDGDSTLPLVSDTFPLRILQNDFTSAVLEAMDDSNTGGMDILRGGDGANILVGGDGANILEGGSGRDTFRKESLDGIDRVVDFVVSEDLLDFTSLFLAQGIDYNPQTFNVIDNLKLSETVDGSLISFQDTEVMLLEGVFGTTLDELFAQGRLLV
jgi:hypothetical protein